MEQILTIISALGGWEAVKYLLNRRSNRRIAGTKADAEEFSLMRECVQFLQQQLLAAEQRASDQTALVRHLNSEILQVTREKSILEAELSLKRCERRGCSERQPQSNY